MRKIFTFMLSSALLFGMFSCTNDPMIEPANPTETTDQQEPLTRGLIGPSGGIAFSPEFLHLNASGWEVPIYIETGTNSATGLPYPVTIVSAPSWVSLMRVYPNSTGTPSGYQPGDSYHYFVASPNSGNERWGQIVYTCATGTNTLLVLQDGAPGSTQPVSFTVNNPYSFLNINFTITANLIGQVYALLPEDVISTPSWLHLVNAGNPYLSGTQRKQDLVFRIDRNLSTSNRSGDVLIGYFYSAGAASGYYPTAFKITQSQGVWIFDPTIPVVVNP